MLEPAFSAPLWIKILFWAVVYWKIGLIMAVVLTFLGFEKLFRFFSEKSLVAWLFGIVAWLETIIMFYALLVASILLLTALIIITLYKYYLLGSVGKKQA